MQNGVEDLFFGDEHYYSYIFAKFSDFTRVDHLFFEDRFFRDVSDIFVNQGHHIPQKNLATKNL